MWKIFSLILFLYPLISGATPSNDRHSTHLASLTSKHPFDLIGDALKQQMYRSYAIMVEFKTQRKEFRLL